MPPIRTGIIDLTSDRTTTTPEPRSSGRKGPINGICDLTISSELEDEPTHTHQTRKRRSRKPKNVFFHHPITINGHVLHPTEVFDTFWRFAAERKAIDDRRRSGAPFPYVLVPIVTHPFFFTRGVFYSWTDDPILRKYPFCNTFRVLDKTSQFLVREVIEKGSQDPQELVFRVILFNTFTRIDTWKLLERKLGPLTWATYSREKYKNVLHRAKSRGVILYTGSFIKPAPSFSYADNYMNHLCLLEVFMENQITARLMNAEYLADIFDFLASFPSMGDFTTYQLILNLSYTNILNFHPNDFVVPGPGASSGLGKMFGRKVKSAGRGFEIDIIRWLVKTQTQHFKRLGLEFSGLGPDELPMDVADVEHMLCEVDKYSRMAHPQYKGKRTEMRRVFEPSPAHYPAKPCLPKAWSHPDRQIPRIKPGGVPIVQKRYTINRIAARREGEHGPEYLVYWFGYPDSDATWEPETLLMDDAPAAVNEYLAQHGRS